jgi:DNA-binding transcriptional LysR family regulator
MAISKKQLSLRGLRTFCVAGRHQSFRIAAEELFVSASAVSHLIKALEQELQQVLFDRKSQAMELTEAGEALYAEISPLIRQIEASRNAELPLIVHSSRPNAWKEWAESAGCEAPNPSSIVKLNSMIAVARAAERGLGAALVPVPLSDAWFESGSLVRLYSHEFVARDGYYFVYRKTDESRSDIQALRRWILQMFASEP